MITKKESSTIKHTIAKIGLGSILESEDTLAIEEPLEIRIVYGITGTRTVKNVSVTMRTPGNDGELAIGFLFTEGIIQSKSELASVEHCFMVCAENKENIIQVELNEYSSPDLKNADRNFYTTSSCGVCGKGSIDAIKTVSPFKQDVDNGLHITQDVLMKLPGLLRKEQPVFNVTGGLHACALFNSGGDLLVLREDVGRLNALDKLVGAAINADLLPLNDSILLLSGRASFELVQKAAMAGIKIIAAVGAPSSLAVQSAEEFGITLVGFLRESRFNIYTFADRIILAVYKNTD